MAGGKPDRGELDTLKRTVSLVDLARSYGLDPRPPSTGSKNHLARCALHPDTDASLSIHFSDEEGKWLWNCFGCKMGGDTLSFIQCHDKVSFKEALARLRAFAGTLPPTPEPAPPSQDKPRSLPPGVSRHDLLTTVMAHYQKKLLECPEAQAYLQSRVLGDPELWKTFGIGYADGSLLRILPRQGDVRQGLSVLGVLNKFGREHFKGCIVVPVFHPDDGLVELYGRRIDPDARHRHLYLDGPQRGVFNWQALQSAPVVHVTESILDAMSLWVAGISDVVASFSSGGLPEDLDALLDRFSVRQVRLCLDTDEAGQNGAKRFRAHFEAKGITVHAVELPEHDVNQLLVQHGLEAVRQAVLTPAPESRPRVRPALVTMPEQPGAFTLELDDVRYQVTARPPFHGHLRVLLKAWHQEKHHPETLDLYNSRNRTMAANNMQRVFGLPKTVLEQHLVLLVEAVETWVREPNGGAHTAPDGPGTPPPPPMTDDERAVAVANLSRPGLMARLKDDLTAMGVVGEDTNKQMVYLIGTSRKMEKPLAGTILSTSGSGKSSMLHVVGQLMPPEEVVSYSRLSPTAPGYMGQNGAKHKLLKVDERIGSAQADYPLRSLLSEGVFTQLVTTKDPLTGKMTVMETKVEGPMAYLETTTSMEINEENASRVFELILREDEDQTARIHAFQRWSASPAGLAARHQQDDIRRRHHHMQRCLESFPVAIPYADRLTFPTRWTRTRRDQARFLNLIMVVAYFHQYQRPRGVVSETGEVYIEATADDYRIAYDLAKGVLATTLHDLPQSCQELWKSTHAMLAQRTQGAKAEKLFDTSFTRRELRTFTRWSDRRVRENLDKLVELEYVSATPGSQGKTYHYRLLPGGDGGSPLDALLTPDALEALLVQAA
jgi:DNA primase